MNNIELPNYVFKKKYDKFYLFTEFDIIFNDSFTSKIARLFELINSEKLIINIEVPDKYVVQIKQRLEFDNPFELDMFYEMCENLNGVDLFYYMINFSIKDDTNSWEVYVSLENELGIFGCTDGLESLFEVIFNPYEEESLEQKYKIIGDMFSDEKTKKEYIDKLEINYNFKSR